MKLRSVISIVLAIVFAFSLMTAQTKEKAASTKSDKKSECSMTNMKSDSKDCTKKGDAASKDCCKKDGKMSEKCTGSDKAKCDMSKGDKSKCPGMKASTDKTGKEKK